MDQPALPERRRFLADVVAAAGALLLPLTARAEPDSVATVAIPDDPGSLDPMPSTSSTVSEIGQHIWETLYVADRQWRFHPLLAAAMPDITADGRRLTIRLRPDVTFHDGSSLTAEDVVASLQRWVRLAARGKQMGGYVDSLTAIDEGTIRYDLKKPYAPLVAQLSFPSGIPGIMPKRLAEDTGPLRQWIGTGPYQVIEYKPDTYVRLGRNRHYSSPSGPPDGYAGTRTPTIDELRFVPVPNPTTRADGILAGEYQFADSLTPESFARLRNQPNAGSGVAEPSSWLLVIFNNRKGVMADVRMRRAAQAALNNQDALAAAFGDPQLWKLEGSIYPEGTLWYAPDAPDYGQTDPKRAAALMRQAGYAGQAVRVLTNTQFDYQYKTAQVLAANLTDAGFTVDLQVTDFPTMLRRRENENLWEIFVTSHSVVPDPSLITILNPDYAGWWDTPDKRAALDAFLVETDAGKRVLLWRQLQNFFYRDVPAIKVGSFFNPFAASKSLTGFVPVPFAAFWNARLSS